MHLRETLREQLAASLNRAPYLLRDADELARALPPVVRFWADGLCRGPEEVCGLLSPRDFLFAGAAQVADVVDQPGVPRPGVPAPPLTPRPPGEQTMSSSAYRCERLAGPGAGLRPAA